MKKVLALVLVLAMILSAQAMAFAADSPAGEINVDNVPVKVQGKVEDEKAVKEVATKAIETVSEAIQEEEVLQDYAVSSVEVYTEPTVFELPANLAEDMAIVMVGADGNLAVDEDGNVIVYTLELIKKLIEEGKLTIDLDAGTSLVYVMLANMAADTAATVG